MKRYTLLFLALLAAAMLTQACATGDDLKHIDDQLSDIRADVRTSKVALDAVGQALDSEAKKSRDMLSALDALKAENARLSEELAVIKRNQADLGSKMFTMSGGEMTSLGGRIDEIAHGAETTNAKLDALKAAVTQRMTAIEEALARSGEAAAGGGGSVQPEAATEDGGAAPPDGQGVVIEPAGQPAAQPAGQPAAKPSGDPIQMYQSSYLDYTRGDYEVAIAGFRDYLRFYPDTEYAGNAQYWIGESLYSLGRYADALAEFDKVVKGFPDSQKAPGAMLKTGYCYEKLGNASAAKAAFESLIKKYPNSDAAKLAGEKLKPQTRGQVPGR